MGQEVRRKWKEWREGNLYSDYIVMGGGTCLIKGEERKRKKEMSSISSCIQTLRTQLVN